MSRWALLAMVPVLAAGAAAAGCADDEPRRPTPIEVFRGHQADFDALRQRLGQVRSVLPARRAGKPSCLVPAPLDPAFAYRTGYLADSNAEVMMERELVDPDTQLDPEKGFAFPPTYLLKALRWTGPRGPLGDNSIDYPAPNLPTAPAELERLRTEMNRAKAARYVVVLRQVEYVSPHVDRKKAGGAIFETFVGRVVLDAFLVDLQDIQLLCQFSVEDEINPVSVIYRADQGPFSGMYKDLRDGAGTAIAEQLTALTRGTADSPG